MNQLISVDDIQTAINLKKWGFLGKGMSWLIYQWMELPKLNRLFRKVKDLDEEDFYEKMQENLGINYEIFEEDLKRIPEQGPFIIVSNHPLGAWDGIIMMKIISKIRPDFKIMGNFLLKKIPPLENRVIAVNPFEEHKDAYSSMTGMKNALSHIKNGGGLGIFPAGEVSRKNFKTNEIYDRHWQESAMKLVQKSKVPVIPMYFHAKNGRVFYRWGLISRNIQTAMLPIEMMRERIKPIKLRIGKPISPKDLERFDDLQKFSTYVRKRVYLLKSYYSQRKNLLKKFNFNSIIKISKAKPIAEETDQNLLIEEIEILRQDDEAFLYDTPNYEIYLSKAYRIPNLLREIGRLREITFRKVGEGSNKALDLDSFDYHYYHLILWDKKEHQLVGAYRLGLGNEIFHNQGIKGFYISSLFNFDKEIIPFFRKTIEMGRAFIREEYQQKPLPLFTLWKGIVLVCLRFPEHKFLLGGVSISNQFSDLSKSLIVEFMRSNFYDPLVAEFIHAKQDYKVKLKVSDRDFLNDNIQSDINQFDKMIDELEPSDLRLPVLVKKYFKQNAKVVAFNVDPKFNDAIDGLMYIRVSDIPESTIKPILDEYLEKLQKQ